MHQRRKLGINLASVFKQWRVAGATGGGCHGGQAPLGNEHGRVEEGADQHSATQGNGSSRQPHQDRRKNFSNRYRATKRITILTNWRLLRRCSAKLM